MAKIGRWEIGDSVGEGGQGRIFFATDTEGQYEGRFAIKRLKNIARKDLFEREVNAVLKLDHPNILKIVDFNLSGEKPFYVAEYCEKKSLAVTGAAEFKGDIRRAVAVLEPVIDALEAAHSVGIVHRDMKPQNVLRHGDDRPVVADFGICHMEGADRITLTDEAMGAVNYIAPEMESGSNLGGPTSKTDVYSIAKVVYGHSVVDSGSLR